MDSEIERLSAAAGALNKAFLPRFETVPDIEPETVVGATARMAGTMLFRSFTPPGGRIDPGAVVVSDEANTRGPKLMELMFATLRHAGHDITEQSLDDRDATADAVQLSLAETQALLDPAVRAYCESAGITLEEAAHALAITTGLFVHDCRTMLDVRKGAAIAIYGFMQGCRTEPGTPKSGAHTK
jgi:hypothetical protein